MRNIGIFLTLIICLFTTSCKNKNNLPVASIDFNIVLSKANNHIFQMEMTVNNINKDTIIVKLPKWMPGYYQIMNYDQNLENIHATDIKKQEIKLEKVDSNTWQIINPSKNSIHISYDIKTTKQFVANSYIDSTHAYIIPENNFLYLPKHLNMPVRVNIISYKKNGWSKIATGLSQESNGIYTAADFDILYDCPILIGNLESLPSFTVEGKKHQFIAYNPGNFNKQKFNEDLKKVVIAASSFIGELPYNQYTFIGIGPGHGGIEHLNNTTISFDGNQLKSEKKIQAMMSFIAHEYFHLYNVKRIRPVELGPFDYSKPNRTTQLWVSEGLTVYYEYMAIKKAGITTTDNLLASFETHINDVQNNPGHLRQTLIESSYNTWEDGPFGIPGKTISYYEKGPLIGLLLDLSIRNATKNKKSLDDVMRYMYQHYYKNLKRGFTDAEFQQACEQTSGILLTDIFEYIHTTKELNYNKYLIYAGLKLEKTYTKGDYVYQIKKIKSTTQLQQAIFKSWAKE